MQRNLLSFGAISIVLLLGVIGNLAYGQRTPVPKTAAELFEALKLTEGQRTKFEALEEQRKQAQAKFKGLAGEALRKAQNDFYTERRKKLKEVFAEKQWTLWQSYWNRKKNAPSPDPESKPGSSVNLSTTSLVESTNLDRFGGWKAKQFDATGFFHTHHDGLRWWLVTPDGHPFLSFGLNHFHAAHWNAPYNRAHWTKQFGAQKSFDPKWAKAWRKEVLRSCRELGITALGIHNDAYRLADKRQGAILPYIRRFEPVKLSHYTYPTAARYHDVFAPEFVAHCDEVAKQQALPFKDDPMLIGYSMSDAPRLTDASVRHRPPGATTWPRVLRNLGPKAPGKQAYVKLLRKRHNDVAVFNKAYGTTFDSWQVLVDAEAWRPRTDYDNQVELEDNAAFLRLCIDRYYTVAKAALREVDRNHLFLGDKLGARGANFDAVIEAAAPHVDVINYGHYGRLAEQEVVLNRWTGKLKKPFLSADGSFSVRSEMLPNPMGPAAKDWAECSAWTRALAAGLFARPDVVGWNICGVMEVWKTAPGREKKQHQGIMDPFGKFKPGMDTAIRDVTSRLYHIADSQSTEAKGKKPKNITIKKINGRHWLVGPDGKPFFAHGITHVSSNRAKIDFVKISKACKELGFNAYGYGCPVQLRSDMPYIESWNHLVPISLYRGKNAIRFVDVFDPEKQAQLEAGVKVNCFRSRSNPHNVIGYCWTDLGSWPLKNPSGKNWVDFIRSLPEDALGQQAYRKFLSTWKGDEGKARDQAFLPPSFHLASPNWNRCGRKYHVHPLASVWISNSRSAPYTD